MPIYTRNLLLFLVLSGAAVLTFMLSRQTEAPAEARANGSEPPRGYYLTDAVLTETNDDGRIHSRIEARRLEQDPDSEDFALSGIRVEYALESDTRWQLDAENGFMPKDRSFFELRDVHIALRRAAGTELTTFETPELRLDAEQAKASTSERVTIRSAENEMVAEGMTLDLDAGTYTLGPYAITIRAEP